MSNTFCLGGAKFFSGRLRSPYPPLIKGLVTSVTSFSTTKREDLSGQTAASVPRHMPRLFLAFIHFWMD